jgi:thiamine-phosphate pyrophosphorylase
MRLPIVYPILDTATLLARAIPPATAAEAMLEGGARILQLRHKGHFTREMFETAKSISEQCRAADVPFVVNDRADIARLLNAGLHLGQDDIPPADARRIVGGSAMLGYSTHNEAQLRAAADEPADYLALGPIFATGSKENPDAVVGLENLSRWRPLTSKPLVAIGGITRENARQVLAAGADSLAIIGDLYPPEFSKHTLRARMEEWLKLIVKVG